MLESATLADLLERARQSDGSARIELRDSIAAHGSDAIEAMADWIEDERLGAFAVRVLEAIAKDPHQRSIVADVLQSPHPDGLPSFIAEDIEQALHRLGIKARTARSPKRTIASPLRSPGVPGRGYWVMRTSPWEREFIWAELQSGRLRQGWGSTADQSLDVIADAVQRGSDLTDDQRLAWRSRRMRGEAPDGIRVGDLIVAANLPNWGTLVVVRVLDTYRYALSTPRQFGERFGHVLPVEVLRSGIDRRAPTVGDGLRSMLGVQTRLYSVTPYGGEVERLVGNGGPFGRVESPRSGEPWTDDEYALLFDRFPPEATKPPERELAAMSELLGRSPDAIEWQWSDGSSYVQGRSATTTSEQLARWLDRRRSEP